MNTDYRILTLSPGSTSTKMAVFEGEKQLCKVNVTHDKEKLAGFAEIIDQLDYRRETILSELEKAGFRVEDMDAFAAYSGALVSTTAGIYPVNETMLRDSREGRTAKHPAMLGALLIHELASRRGVPAYVIDHPDSDEFWDLARVTGLPGVYRQSKIHVLNQKEAARRAAKALGKTYEGGNYIVAHVGGGLSVAAHLHGRIVDGNDVINGSGPMAPNRSGDLPAGDVIRMCFSGKYTERQMKELVGKTGGWLGHLGTDDARGILRRIAEGDQYAELVFNAMAYQLAKAIGGFAAALEGEVDAIVLTGGVSNSSEFVEAVSKRVSWIAPVQVFGGDFEMEALAAGAVRALRCEEELKNYTGESAWNGFPFAPESKY